MLQNFVTEGCYGHCYFNSLTHRQFQHFLEETETKYGNVVYYLAVRSLSRGAVMKIFFFYLRSEIDTFMTEKGKTVPQLSDDKCILELAFPVDITTCLNELNVKLQGKGNYCLTSSLMLKHLKLN
jgi:hypothetical protein